MAKEVIDCLAISIVWQLKIRRDILAVEVLLEDQKVPDSRQAT